MYVETEEMQHNTRLNPDGRAHKLRVAYIIPSHEDKHKLLSPCVASSISVCTAEYGPAPTVYRTKMSRFTVPK
jgi:hypothetical protein